MIVNGMALVSTAAVVPYRWIPRLLCRWSSCLLVYAAMDQWVGSFAGLAPRTAPHDSHGDCALQCDRKLLSTTSEWGLNDAGLDF